MVDSGRVRALLDRLQEETGHLRRLSERSDDELINDADLLAAIKYRFIVAIETCIDVGQHIIASEGLRAPADYGDIFEVLAEAGFVQKEAASPLREMARFRNLLVHGYRKVNERTVVEILETRLGDLDAFRASVAARVSAGGS